MKVLFISKSKHPDGASPIVLNQGKSLQAKGVQLEYFLIEKNGFPGIFSNLSALRKVRKEGSFDVIHAHYAFWGYLATLAGCRPLVVSLMGSDLVYAKWYKHAIRFFNRFFWKKLIVKSQEMLDFAKTKNTVVIPNGIDLEVFKPMERMDALKKAGWSPDKKHILFAADENRPEKNFELTRKAFDLLNNPDYELHTLGNIPHELMPGLYNAADVVILSSLREGSPNVVKEAMACNRPVIATDVGDVRQHMSSVYGCFITSFEPEDMADNIEQAMQVNIAESREAIAHLSAERVAEKLMDVYKSAKSGQ
ncbi:MAG: glycosyltransferase family 4 protein [Roseivirga sp.]